MNASQTYSFTSESVGEGHPDKIADQISDAILDQCIRSDRNARVACETFVSTGLVLVGGEMRTTSYIDVAAIVRDVLNDIGYNRAEYGFECNSVGILSAIHQQSPDIARGVDAESSRQGKQGAGDQGMVFGFACDETPELMPAPIGYAHAILRCAARLRKDRSIPWLRPDAKSQVTVEYVGHTPKRISDVVLSHQHDDHIDYQEICEVYRKKIIEPALRETGLIDDETRYFINPTGRFVIGGPQGDSGLTGRKIVVDTYGGSSRHGGGAFSGKDPSKTDRSAAYAARYVAKNIVAAGVARRCEVQIAYAIGVAQPVSLMVDTFGTAMIPERHIERSIGRVFDLTPRGIIQSLDLLRPIYRETTCYGHFGRPGLPWEKTDRVQDILDDINRGRGR